MSTLALAVVASCARVGTTSGGTPTPVRPTSGASPTPAPSPGPPARDEGAGGLGYAGLEAGAAWRPAAAERIEKIRKAELTVRVKDPTGRAVADAQVTIHQTRQAFGLGTGVDARALGGTSGQRYGQVLTELFNVATLDDNLEWVPLAGERGPAFTIETATDAIVWLRDHGLDVRGHALIWPGWRNLPRGLRAHESNRGYLRTATMARIRDVVTAVKGTVVQWDVVNEPLENHDLIDILGEDVMVDWFKAARAADPLPKLFINDDVFQSGSGGDARRARYEETIELLESHHAPLDGIGIQGHFGAPLTAPEELLAILDRFAKLGKTIWITEYEVDIPDDELAGRFTRDFYTTMFSHPAVGGVVMRGFWDSAHGRNGGALYRKDWSLKPAGEAFRELALEGWRTDASGRTDAEGTLSRRAFLGDYAIEASFGGKTKSAKARLEAAGLTVTVVLR